MSQKITNERIGRDTLTKSFADMVVSDTFLRRIGPAVNSGRALLLYGPPGNGKTSIAERISNIYADVIYVPHCIEVDGQSRPVLPKCLRHVESWWWNRGSLETLQDASLPVPGGSPGSYIRRAQLSRLCRRWDGVDE